MSTVVSRNIRCSGVGIIVETEYFERGNSGRGQTDMYNASFLITLNILLNVIIDITFRGKSNQNQFSVSEKEAAILLFPHLQTTEESDPSSPNNIFDKSIIDLQRRKVGKTRIWNAAAYSRESMRWIWSSMLMRFGILKVKVSFPRNLGKNFDQNERYRFGGVGNACAVLSSANEITVD